MDHQAETDEGQAPGRAELDYAKFVQEFSNQLSEIILRIENDPNITAEQKEQALKDEGAKLKTELQQRLTALENIRKFQPADKTKLTEEAKKQEDDAKKGVREALAKTIIAAEKGVELTKDKKVQTILAGLGEEDLSMEQAGRIADKFGAYLTGDKPIILTEPDKEKSEFMKEMESLKTEDQTTYGIFRDVIERRPEPFGKKEEDINKILPTDKKEQTIEEQKKQQIEHRLEEVKEERKYHDILEYYGRFSAKQQKFLSKLYTPEAFKDYIKEKIYGDPNNKKSIEDITAAKNDIKKEIIKFYHEQGRDTPEEAGLNNSIERLWRQKKSWEIRGELGDVMNQLLLRLQLEAPNKPFDQLAQEDFMRGILATQNAIRNVLMTLQKNLEAYENDPEYSNIELYKMIEEGHYTEEREVEIDKKTGEMRKVPYSRLKPLVQPEKVNLREFVTQLNMDFNDLNNQRNYLHDSRFIFSQPPGKEGFYAGLGGYAEKYRGIDIDNLSLLPDGDIALEAFYLYEKYLEEEMAMTDWRTRPTLFMPEVGSPNTQLENQIIRQMMLEYGKKGYSEDRIRAALNIGVGMARAVYLTEPEKSSYCDPVDEKGQGMVASYGTNDAGALYALNPLHVELRWGGEHHLYMYYFMPIHGEHGIWDHKKLSINAEKYFDSYIKGKRDLPDNLFINEMIGVTKAGGPFTRRGWRLDKSIEGFFKYKDIDLGNGKKMNIVDAVETFKAINYLGFEPICHFLTQKFLAQGQPGEVILSAKEGTVLGNERKALFKYIYELYFKEFDGLDFDGYMKSLRKVGEEAALEKLAETKSAPKGWEAFLESKISDIFLKRAVARVVALRFPTKFLRIDRSCYQKEGVSRWQQVQLELSMDREDFNRAMKDFEFVEVLLRKGMSKTIKDQLSLVKGLDLNQLKLNYESINEVTIDRLLTSSEDGSLMLSADRIANIKKIYRQIKKDFFDNKKMLNEEGWKAIEGYPFSFGVEDTALDLMAFRATGPRMVARVIKDTGILEQGAVSAISKLGRTLQQMAIDGKHDFSPIIEAMLKARQAFNDVHGTGDDQKFNYNIATAVIQYFKKDSMAKPLFGLFRIGKRNSWAAEYAGRSTAVWEWDSRDIDRFITALESYRILPKTYYDIHKAKGKNAEYENVYWINPITKKVIKTPFKKLKTDYEWNAKRLRKEFGGDFKSELFDFVNDVVPIALIFVFWNYFKKALEETEGKKR